MKVIINIVFQLDVERRMGKDIFTGDMNRSLAQEVCTGDLPHGHPPGLARQQPTYRSRRA